MTDFSGLEKHEYVYMCMHILCVCLHLCVHKIYVHTHVCTHVCVCTHMHVHMYVCAYACAHIYLYTQTADDIPTWFTREQRCIYRNLHVDQWKNLYFCWLNESCISPKSKLTFKNYSVKPFGKGLLLSLLSTGRDLIKISRVMFDI